MLTTRIELGTSCTEGFALTNCATLAFDNKSDDANHNDHDNRRGFFSKGSLLMLPLFPLRTRLTCFNHYLKDRVTNEANYDLILAAQLQNGRVVSYGS